MRVHEDAAAPCAPAAPCVKDSHCWAEGCVMLASTLAGLEAQAHSKAVHASRQMAPAGIGNPRLCLRSPHPQSTAPAAFKTLNTCPPPFLHCA